MSLILIIKSHNKIKNSKIYISKNNIKLIFCYNTIVNLILLSIFFLRYFVNDNITVLDALYSIVLLGMLIYVNLIVLLIICAKGTFNINIYENELVCECIFYKKNIIITKNTQLIVIKHTYIVKEGHKFIHFNILLSDGKPLELIENIENARGKIIGDSIKFQHIF